MTQFWHAYKALSRQLKNGIHFAAENLLERTLMPSLTKVLNWFELNMLENSAKTETVKETALVSVSFPIPILALFSNMFRF